MFVLKKGDILLCKSDIYNSFKEILFKKNNLYKITQIDSSGGVYLDHNLFANEYHPFDMNYILNNFKIIK